MAPKRGIGGCGSVESSGSSRPDNFPRSVILMKPPQELSTPLPLRGTAAPHTTQSVALNRITLETSLQIRQELNQEVVEEYALAMARKPSPPFPPVVLFESGGKYFLADGFHRFRAAAKAGLDRIEAEIHRGSKTDALRFALGANARHGLRLSNADKRRAAALAIHKWPDLSNRELGKICGCSHNFIREMRAPLELSSDSSCTPAVRIGADGKRRKLPAGRKRVTASRVWECLRQSTPERKGQALMEIVGTGIGLVWVPDKEAFTRAIHRWLEESVVEGKKQ